MIQLCKVWNFAQDYTDFMNRYYVSVLPVPQQVSDPANTTTTFSIEVGRYLIYLCRCLRPTFEKLYMQLDLSSALTEEQFMQFCIGRCEKFCSMHDNMALLVACAFISELNNYIILKDTFGKNMASSCWKCFLAIFRRQFQVRFCLDNGWEGLSSFCSEKNASLIPSTYNPVINLNPNHFIQHSLGGQRDLFDKYITIPLAMTSTLDTFLPLNEFERVLLSCNLSSFRTSENPERLPRCEYCSGPCIDHVYNSGIIDDLRREWPIPRP